MLRSVPPVSTLLASSRAWRSCGPNMSDARTDAKSAAPFVSNLPVIAGLALCRLLR